MSEIPDAPSRRFLTKDRFVLFADEIALGHRLRFAFFGSFFDRRSVVTVTLLPPQQKFRCAHLAWQTLYSMYLPGNNRKASLFLGAVSNASRGVWTGLLPPSLVAQHWQLIIKKW